MVARCVVEFQIVGIYHSVAYSRIVAGGHSVFAVVYSRSAVGYAFGVGENLFYAYCRLYVDAV